MAMPSDAELREVERFFVFQADNGIFIYPFTSQAHLDIVYCHFRQFQGDVGDNITVDGFISMVNNCGKAVKEIYRYGENVLYEAKPPRV